MDGPQVPVHPVRQIQVGLAAENANDFVRIALKLLPPGVDRIAVFNCHERR
jgi:hypothetical protein